MATIAEALSLAVRHHLAGNLRLAEQLYQQILQTDPDHADAHHLIGVVAYQTGRFELAINAIRQALTLNPQVGAYHSNLGLAQEGLGQLEEAVASHQRALALQPDVAETHNNLGNALVRLEKFDEAAACFREALRINPQIADVHNGLGCALERQDRLDEAIHCFQEAVKLKPDLAQAHNNLGNALARQDKLDEAIASYQEALRLKADFSEAYANLGSALVCQNKLQDASKCYEQALRCDPASASARWNRSLLSLLRGDCERGWPEYECRWALPGNARRPFAQPLWDGSPLAGRTILLYAEQGLGDTLQFLRYAPLVRQQGGKVVVVCQPALVPLLAEAGKVRCPMSDVRSQMHLFRHRTSDFGLRTPWIDLLLGGGAPLPPFDVQAPLLSLPGIMHTSLANVPAPVPYLHPADELVAHWCRELRKSRKSEVESRKSKVRSPKSEEVQLTSDFRLPTSDFLVGIAWQGSLHYRYDRQRSIPLAQFAHLAQVPAVQLISLQKGPGTDQLRVLAGQFGVVNLGDGLDETAGAFMDTAAVMKNLDLVIASDSAVAHLAGALGVPVWVALALVPDWRWLLEREDSPWYPTMRLFRQTRYGHWDEVFDHIAEELKVVVRKVITDN